MKKFISIILSLSLMIGLFGFSTTAFAQVYTGACGDGTDGNTAGYTLDTETGELTISGTGATKNYILEGGSLYDVTKSNYELIKKITVSSKVTHLGDYIFTNVRLDYYSTTYSDGFPNLTEVQLGSGVKSIGKYSFYKAISLPSITIPSSCVLIDEGAFSSCTSLRNVKLGSGLKTLENNVFNGDSSLETINFPYNLESIGEGCFYRCRSLAGDYVLQSKLASIGKDAFYDCSSINSIAITNPNCDIYKSNKTIPLNIKIKGHIGSTAQKYAEEFGNEFEAIYGETTQIVEPTCTEQGYTLHICDDCDSTYKTDFTDALGHNEVFRKAKPATCEENGYTKGYVCSRCNEVFSGCEVIPATGHTWNSGVKQADGSTLFTCTVCQAIKTEQAEHTHTWSEWKYNGDAVYNSSKDYKNGTRTHTCSVCGVSETEEAPNTALLRKRGNALALESNITLATYVGKDVVDYYDEVYAEFTRNGKTTKVYPSKKTLNANSTEYNIFDYKGISPQALGDEISITVYGIKDGTTYWGNTATYSATDYIKSTLADSSTDTNLKTLLVDLVYYGEACQMYQGYNTDKPLTDILTDKQKTFRSTGDLTLTNIKNSSYATCDNRLVKLGTALRLSDSVELAIPLNMTDVTVNDLTMKVEVGNRTLNYSYAENPECFELGKDGYWYFYFNGLYANQLSDEVFITAYRGEEQVSYTLRYSAESYAATVKDEKLKAVTDAMMRYGNSAKAYKQGYRAWR